MTIDDTAETSSLFECWGSRLLIVIALVLHTAALMNVRPLQSANDRSRWCTVWSLVERGTFQIDEIRQHQGWDSIDIIYDEGHFYSTKPPLLSVIVAGVTWCVQRVTGWTLLNQTQPLTATVLCVVNILPFAVSLVLLSQLLHRVSTTSWCRLFVLGAAAFGTLVTPFLVTLNNHTVAVAGVIVSLYALERVLCTEQPVRWMFALCGVASAWFVCNELPAAVMALTTFLLAWRKSPRHAWWWYVPAALVPLAAFLVTNIVATGSWKPTYAGYGSSKYNFVIDGVPSYWREPHGVDRNIDSPLMYFVHCTVGHHGILSLTPLFLLSVAGWLSNAPRQNPFMLAVLRWGPILVAINLAFFMTRTQNYNFGGVSCALRWAIWLIPFWLLALVPVLDSTFRSTSIRIIATTLLAVSMFSAWLPIDNPWQQPWLFRAMERWSWIDYRDDPSTLPRTLWTWFPSIPQFSKNSDEFPWVEFSSQQPDGSVSRRRMTLRSPVSLDDLSIVEVLVQEAMGSEELHGTRKFMIDRRLFETGAPAAEFMDWADPAVTPEQQQSDLAFVRGLPLMREYRAGRTYYLKTSLRKDAFRCQIVAAAVDSSLPDGQILRYRCDAWLCDELPFGVAQVEFQITDPMTKETLHHEQWLVSDCHPKVSKSAPNMMKLP